MYRRKRILLLSSSIILLCACLIAGATFALFTDSTEVKTHLKAGDLKANLIRESAYRTILTDDGRMTKVRPDPEVVDFTEDNSKNFFGFEDGDLIVPLSVAEAVFRIENKGTVAFTYDVKIKFEKGSETDEAQAAANAALANQLYVEIGFIDEKNTDENGKVVYSYKKPVAEGFMKNGSFELSSGAENPVLAGDENNSSALMYARVTFVDNDSSDLVTDKEFKDGTINNNAMSGKADFDLIVEATQYTTLVSE